MEKNKKYIFQLTSKDIEEMSMAANIHSGEGIDIIKTEDGLEVSIDRQKLERWIKVVIQGGNIQ